VFPLLSGERKQLLFAELLVIPSAFHHLFSCPYMLKHTAFHFMPKARLLRIEMEFSILTAV
jgi:hypothetical protein